MLNIPYAASSLLGRKERSGEGQRDRKEGKKGRRRETVREGWREEGVR